MKDGISWVILVTDDYKKSCEFYKNKLGFPVEREVKAKQFCQFVLANCFLAIYGRQQYDQLLAPQKLGSAGGAVYSFPDSDNIDADYQHLLSKGVKFIKAPTTQSWGQRTAYFTDPDGHIWELQQWIEKK